MAESSSTSRVTFIVLRFMRRPLMVLVTVYAISMAGWVLIPGLDPEGNPQHLSFFHAFYFLTYTATTTGFGELPYAFTNAQRMWGIVSLYASVIAWIYAIGSIIRLLQNLHFLQAVAERRFAKNVKRITEPFHMVCGFGNTGSLLTRGLSDAGMTAVIIDKDIERIKALNLRDYHAAMPGLWADARDPQHLIEAGLLRGNCKAVVALTHDEAVNLKIAVTARLLNPSVRIIIQSTSEVYEETIATLGGDVHIIDPFQTYAKYLGATIHDPAIHMLMQWLSGTRGATLERTISPPKGRWILCGFGRMGRWIRESLEAQGIETVVIDPRLGEENKETKNLIAGRATQATLERAGVRDAAGVVAGTDSDSDNLGVLLNARALNPNLFLVVRQNEHSNEVVFSAARADLIMQPSLVSARRVLFLLVAPLLKTFFEHARRDGPVANDRFLGEAIDRLRRSVGGDQPRLWTVKITEQSAGAYMAIAKNGAAVTMDDILRDPVDRERHLACLPLVVQSAEQTIVMPEMSYAVKPDDQILFCGTNRASTLLQATLNNEYTLRYLIAGVDETRSIVLRWALGKAGRRAART